MLTPDPRDPPSPPSPLQVPMRLVFPESTAARAYAAQQSSVDMTGVVAATTAPAATDGAPLSSSFSPGDGSGQGAAAAPPPPPRDRQPASPAASGGLHLPPPPPRAAKAGGLHGPAADSSQGGISRASQESAAAAFACGSQVRRLNSSRIHQFLL